MHKCHSAVTKETAKMSRDQFNGLAAGCVMRYWTMEFNEEAEFMKDVAGSSVFGLF